VQIAGVVFFAEETRLTIMPTLHDAERYAIEVDAGAARPEGRLARKYIEPENHLAGLPLPRGQRG
jgi:hypothetical protein